MNIFTKAKFLCLLLFVFTSVSNILAQVSIAQPTGGQNISADKALGGSAAGYTALGDIVIADQVVGDFAVGTDRKIYLVPSVAHWQIEPGVGSISFGGTNITAASILVEANKVTITYTVVGTSADDNSMTISGIRVQSNTTLREPTAASLRRTTSSTLGGPNNGIINGFGNNGQVATLSEIAGNFTQLQVLLPGETSAPGTPSGKIGTPTDRSAGVNTTVTVNAVDAYWNRVTTVTDQIAISTTDANATVPAANTLNAGTRNFTVVFRTIGTVTATATNNTSVGIAPVESSAANVVLGPFTKLQVLLPGETAAPGTATGKTGTPNAQVAGTPFVVSVRTVDAAWNLVTGITDEIRLSTSDANATMPANMAMETDGEIQFSSVGLVTGGSRTITATNITDGTKTANTSPNVVIGAGAYTKLQILLPGEGAAPGTATGKTAALPTDRSVGIAFNVTVNAVDAYWNRVTGITDVINISTNDASATTPVNTALANGTRNFSVTLRTPSTGTTTVTATNTSNGAITQAVSVGVNVVGGVFTKLQILLPGETADPGTATGKIGTPTAQVAGTPFVVRVRAVDGAWNLVTGITDVIRLTTTDANATMPTDLAMEADGEIEFTLVNLITGGNRTITATNITDGTKTANVSPSVAVGAGVFTKLQVLMPGEMAAPGTSTGKTGIPTDRNSGTAFNVVVNAVDAYWNRVAVTPTIAITTTDPNATLPANAALGATGTRNFSVTLRTIGSATVTATDISAAVSPVVSETVNVVSGGFAKLQLLLPGEIAAPGTSTGKTGTPNAQVAGVPFTVTVNAVDAGWNLINTVTDVISFTATGDTYAQLPSGLALVNGTLTTSVTYRLGNATVNRRLTVADVTDNTKTSNQSPSFGVNIGSFSKLLIVLPGETYTAGHLSGKTGTPLNQGAGAAFNITVRATDEGFNTVLGVTDIIGITSSDGAAVLPANAALANGVKTNFSVRLNTISNSNTITATNITDETKTPYTTGGVPVLTPSATTDYFRSVIAAGSWNTSSSWESSADGLSGWQPSTLVPASASSGITVRNGHVISVTANLTIDDVVIENGGQVTLTNGNLTIANGTAPVDFNVAGTLRANNGRTITTTGTLQFASGGKYQHAYTTTSGTIPTATWATGSVCEIVGYTDLAVDVTGTNQTFSDFVWNTTALTGSPSLLSGFAARNFTVTSTGTIGTLNLAATGGTTSITGNYTQTAGNVIANKTSGTHNLTFAGNVAVNGGSFGLGNGTVNINFNGASQSIVNSGSAIAFQNVNFSNGGTKTLTSGSFSLATTGVLTMGASTTLNANGNLTLLSDASSSATIANIPSSSAITGNVTVQRFITGGTANHRTYRMLSSPVYDNGNSGNRQYSFAQFADDIIVSGTGAGFYPTPNNAASAWTYDGTQSGDKYVPIPNVNTSIPVGQGAYLFYRGDKVNNLASKVSAPYAIPESFPMTFTGVLNQQNVGLSLTAGFNLVGNPYASSIDWNTIAKTNLQNNTIRIWNPSSRSYASYNGDTGVPSGMNNIIAAGQGFFVQSNAGGSLSFTESSKVSSQPSSLLMSSPLNEDLMANEVLPANGKVMVGGNGGSALAAQRTELRFALKKADLPYQIETAVVLQEGRNAAYSSADDVNYITASGDEGTQVFFSTLSNDNRKLTINYLPEVSASATVKLDLDTRNAAGDYTLHINTIKDIPAGYIAKLNDALLGTSTVVQNGDIYPFTINANNAASAGATRFSVSFEAPITLPVDLSVFAVAKTNQGVAVKWSTKTEVNNDRFELERAGENGVYTKIYTEYAKGSGYAYSYLDKSPLLGNNYYRLVQFDLDGKKTTSEPKVINYSNEIGTAEGLTIYPNPVKDKFLLKFNGVLQANAQIVRVVNSLGQVVLTKTISKHNLVTGYEFTGIDLSSGVYTVEVLDNGNHRLRQLKMIKQ